VANKSLPMKIPLRILKVRARDPAVLIQEIPLLAIP